MRMLPLGLIAGFAFIVAACGANPVPSDDVADAGARTKAAGTVRLETISRVSVVGSPAETFEFRSTGIIDYANDRSEYREESSGCRTIMIGDITYGELPADGGFPAGKRWVEFGGEANVGSEALFEQNQQQNADDEGGTSTSIILFATPDPTADDYLDYLREGSREPERVGHEDVRGVSTTHYRGDVDVRSRIEADLETAGWKSANIERYVEDIEQTREIDVWVDSDGRARRVVTTEDTSGAEEGMTGGWVTTTEYFDFGLEAEIQAPPAAEMVESEEWERITEKEMREELDEYALELEEGITPLPGTFAPSTASDVDSAESSCRR